ncbi:MAG: ECF RNA polymerase sigma factor SigR [Planctomycetota bacterium]|nr:MAG: ECF RNA polymerase sigma factor SigR [Planctomycetota bacterium]
MRGRGRRWNTPLVLADTASTTDAGRGREAVASGGGTAEGAAERRRAEFEELVLPHLDAMYRVAVRLGGRERAEDAVQEAVLRAWRYYATFQQGAEVRPWLFAILRNVVYERGRRQRRRLKTSSLDAYGADNVVAPARLPLDERIRDEAILAALERLPQDYRAVVVLALIEDLKYREIAEVLGIPIGTVMSRLHRGRKLLRYFLGQYAAEAGVSQAG